jgi:hypothetical protein
MMIQGETLIAGDGDCVAFSPWFEACGSGATFVVEVGPRTGGPGTFEIRVETKNTENDDASATTLDRVDTLGPWVAFPDPSGGDDPVYINPARYTGFKELVRFKYVLEVEPPARRLSVHFRMLPPLWEANCLGCSIEDELARDVQMEI